MLALIRSYSNRLISKSQRILCYLVVTLNRVLSRLNLDNGKGVQDLYIDVDHLYEWVY